jgi:hypothetical protein
MIFIVQEQNTLEAEKFLEAALEADRRSFPALIEYIQVLMASPNENDEKLCQLFERELSNPEWDAIKLANMCLMKGLHFIMKEDKDSATASWLEAYGKSKDAAKLFQVNEN